ncbi:hypothetical protein GCM10023237_47890 [Streptomyces coeruleoprunus]
MVRAAEAEAATCMGTLLGRGKYEAARPPVREYGRDHFVPALYKTKGARRQSPELWGL